MANKNFEVKHGLSVGGTQRISSTGVGTFTDLNVTGTTTTIDTATLQVQDKNIVINYGSGDTSSTASGAGITIQDAVNSSTDATLLWDASADEFDFSHAVTAPSLKSTGASTFDSTLTSTGLLLTENTSLYNVNATISYYSSTNGVYVNGAGNNGWLRLNASGTQNARNSIDLFGSSAGDYVKIKAKNVDTMYFGSSTAGYVGIGTSTAAKPLHIYSSDNHPLRVESSDAYAGIEIKDSGSATLPPLHSALSNDHIFYAGHASARPEVMRIGSDGKVAINQASLTENLTVNGTGAVSGKFAVLASSVHGSFDFYNNGTTYLNGQTYVDDILNVTGSNAEIRAAGNIYLTGSNDVRIKLSDSGISGVSDSNNTIHIRGDNDYMKLNAAGNGGFIFEINGTEAMRIGSNGNVAMGTTDTTDVQFRVDQNENDDYTAFFKNTCAANAMVGVTFKTDNTVNAANKFGFQIDDNGTERFAARMDGGIANYQGNDYNHSDERLKENITDSESTLDTIKNLKVRNFKYKEQESDRVMTGLIAQEVELVDSSLVSTGTDGYKGIYTTDLYHKMLKAIQEQQELIETQQTTINDLKSRIETLEG